jgi:hypothetical protein
MMVVPLVGALVVVGPDVVVVVVQPAVISSTMRRATGSEILKIGRMVPLLWRPYR